MVSTVWLDSGDSGVRDEVLLRGIIWQAMGAEVLGQLGTVGRDYECRYLAGRRRRRRVADRRNAESDIRALAERAAGRDDPSRLGSMTLGRTVLS